MGGWRRLFDRGHRRACNHVLVCFCQGYLADAVLPRTFPLMGPLARYDTAERQSCSAQGTLTLIPFDSLPAAHAALLHFCAIVPLQVPCSVIRVVGPPRRAGT